ncbi:MAG: DMT family transporter [Thermaerobacter sp.]|nr:DMT family transporter [Thermaerobacter sp.]
MSSLRGALSLAIAAAIWGGVYVVSRVVLRFIPPIPLVAIRLLMTLVVLAPLYFTRRRHPSAMDYLLVLLSGTLGFALSLVAQFYGTAWTSAHIGSLITSSAPAFIALLALPVLGDALHRKQIVALCLALLGAVVVMGPGGNGGASIRGVAALLVAAITWGLYTVLNRRIARTQDLTFVNFWTTAFALAFLLPFSGRVLTLPYAHFSLALWSGILYIGVVSTALAMYLWNYGFTQLPAATGGLFLFVQPIVGILLGATLLGERLSFWLWPGAALILAGVYISLRGDAGAHHAQGSIVRGGAAD